MALMEKNYKKPPVYWKNYFWQSGIDRRFLIFINAKRSE